MIFKAAKAAAQGLGIIDTPEVEDQPCTSDENYALPADPIDLSIPATVGLVEGKVFDPQVPFEILTSVFGVHKGLTNVHNFSCPDCDHTSTLEAGDGLALDDHAECENEDCGYEGVVGDFFDETVNVAVTSQTPTNEECLQVRFGANTMPEWYADSARADLRCFFDNLNGHENLRCGTTALQQMDIHPLPQPEVAAVDDDDEEDE